MKPVEWKTYRTRFLVKAKQLSSSLSFVDPLGRQHCGRKGDYLVESSDGVISIAPRQIFEDIYVPMSLADEAQMTQGEIDERRLIDGKSFENRIHDRGIDAPNSRRLKIEPLNIEEIKLTRSCSIAGHSKPAWSGAKWSGAKWSGGKWSGAKKLPVAAARPRAQVASAAPPLNAWP